MSLGFGLLAQLLSWRVAPKWLWALVSGVYFGVGLLVSEIWDSQEQLEAFGEVLMPILLGQGMEFSSDPDIFEIHDVYRR